jgi:hypothetical protein
MITSTDITIEHYLRPEVRAAILRYCLDIEAWRALNGDDGWYKRGAEAGKVRLASPEDYGSLVEKYRTLYTTLDLFEPSVKMVSERWDQVRGAPERPIGTLANCLAFTPSVDIDSIKGANGKDIVSSPQIKAAVEDAGQFLIDYLKEHGIKRSIYCLYSGGGIYIHVHHALFRSGPDWSHEDREHAFRSVMMAFNALIAEISEKFFEQYPEHKGNVKFDKLNNQKRKFKVLFSIHRKLPFAVIPLDPEHIEIDFDEARIPLSAEVLAKGEQWYQSYDLNELPRLKELLKPYVENAEEELKERKVGSGNYEIRRLATRVPLEAMPPCMKNIIQTASSDRGPHRALAVLAAYLYGARWPEDEAFVLWNHVAQRTRVETRYFGDWYGVMNCPNCKKIQSKADGYPRVGLGEFGYCPGGCKWTAL